MIVDALIILNNFFHDLAAAMWFCGALMLLFIYRQAINGEKIEKEFLVALFGKVKKITSISLVIVLAGGVVRAINYQRYEWLPALGRGQVTLLVVKHILLVVIVIGGVYLQVRLLKNIKRL